MNSMLINYKLPDGIPEFSRQRLDELLPLLSETSNINAVLLGGSQSYNPHLQRADSDLFLLVNDSKQAQQELKTICEKTTDFDVLVFQGFFPWTQLLYTIYFKHNDLYSIDIALIDLHHGDTFFWEPNGIILLDKYGELEGIRKQQMTNKRFSEHPFNRINPFTLAIVTLKKIEKNLHRGHLWNAIELLNIMRRYYMQIMRASINEPRPYLGRPDRDIEDVLSASQNALLSNTVPSYDRFDIAQKTLSLANLFWEQQDYLDASEEYYLKPWILRQLKIICQNLANIK